MGHVTELIVTEPCDIDAIVVSEFSTTYTAQLSMLYLLSLPQKYDLALSDTPDQSEILNVLCCLPDAGQSLTRLGMSLGIKKEWVCFTSSRINQYLLTT